jgi:hypothetical protein
MKIKAKLNTKTTGRFSIAVLDSEGNPVEGKQIAETNNAVTYDGAAKLFTAAGNNSFSDNFYVKVGTGNTEITRSSLDLGSPLAAQTASDRINRSDWGEVDNGDGTATYTLTAVRAFSTGAVTGTISEVGIYMQGGNTFFAGQLIKDEFGDPTTVTLLADEQLVVTYIIEVIAPLQGTLIDSGTVDADGVSTTWELFAQPLLKTWAVNGSADGTIRYNSLPSNVVAMASNGITNLANVSASYTATHNGTGTVTFNGGNVTFAPSSFNSSDCKYLGYSNYNTLYDVDTSTVTEESGSFTRALFILRFTPAINKPSNKSLTLQLDVDINV